MLVMIRLILLLQSGTWETILDNSISMDAHINQVCKAAFYHIHNIRRVSKYLSQECLKTLIHAFVTSRLDYM